MTPTQHVQSVVKLTVLHCAIVALLTVAASPTRSFAQAASACADSTSSAALFYRDYYRTAVSSTETHMVNLRAQTGLPNVAATQVRFIGDTTTCRTASIAFDAQRWDKLPDIPVILFEIGATRLAIKIVDIQGPNPNYLFNQDFSVLLKRGVF